MDRLGIVPLLRIPFAWTGYRRMDSQLVLNRLVFTDHSTIGELSLNDEFQCYTLEDTCRNHKIPRITAIPAGKYEVIITESERFKRLMPLLLQVQNFEGVRIHPGNVAEQTDGCILVGRIKRPNEVDESLLAFNKLFPKLEAALKSGKLYIDIIGGVQPERIS